MAAASKVPSSSAAGAVFFFASPPPRHRPFFLPGRCCRRPLPSRHPILRTLRRVSCEAAEASKVAEGGPPTPAEVGGDGKNWVPVVPLAALPKGERRVIIQDGETILLLWYKDQVFAIENRSPAEGAYSEGLLNAKLTQDGCIVCPTTDSTFDLQTGAIKEWYPKNPVLRALTPALRTLFRYPVKLDGENIYISMGTGVGSGGSAEIVFSGRAQPGITASDVNVDEIGQGTYSTVYKARDLETGKVVALKKVRFVNMDPESVRFMAREIHILRRLDHPNIVKLEGLVTSKMSCSLYLVFEYMEHDLAGLAATPGIKFTEPQVKCYMQQLLSGLEHCHSRGILHRDIKGSNLLLDNNGTLKIADFGLATFFNPDRKQPLTSRVVTLWYRPPELLLGATEYGVTVDLWSTGCILAELLAGKPVMPGRTEVEQLHKIFKLCGSPSDDYWRKSKLPHATIFKPQRPYRRCVAETFKDFPPSALALLDVLLAIEPDSRGTASVALKSDFFTTMPLACDPASLPKYPPSKEFDAKLRDEEVRRQRAAALKGQGSESVMKGSRDSRGIQAPDTNKQVNPKSISGRYNALEDGGSRRNGFSQSGQLHPDAYGSSRGTRLKEDDLQNVSGRSNTMRRQNGQDLMTQRSYMPQAGAADSSSGLVSARTSAKSDNHREKSAHTHWPEYRSTYNQLGAVECSEKPEWRHQFLDRPSSSHKKEERIAAKESAIGYGTKKNRIHYSGPLMPPGGNIEDMLKEHERQIQQAVRKARLDKAKTNKYGE